MFSQLLCRSPTLLSTRLSSSRCIGLNGVEWVLQTQRVRLWGWALNGTRSRLPPSPGPVPASTRLLSCAGADTGLFDKPQLGSPEGLSAATTAALTRAITLVNAITASAGTPSLDVIEQFDEVSDVLCQVADLAECIRQVHPDPEVVERAQAACLAVSDYVEQLNTNSDLHRALKNVMDSDEYSSTDEVTQRTAESLMHDFKISGIHLDDARREEAVRLNSQILGLSHAFVQGASQPVLVRKEGCPTFISEHFRSDSQRVMIDHVPLLSPYSKLRAGSYVTYYCKSAPQQEILETLLSLRHRLAELVGYPTFAHRVLESTMAESPETVSKFLLSLSEKVLPLARDDMQRMQDLKNKTRDPLDSHTLQPWDTVYVSSLAQKQLFPKELQGIENWFSLENCLSGLDNLFRSLFGVRMELTSTKRGETWDPHVKKLAFVDESEGLLGYVYCDLYFRPGKIASNCHFTIQGGRELRDGSYQLPVITLCCGFQPPRGNKQALLTYHSVENLFHEMGHALHSMLGRSKYQNVTGTRCSTDFAEVPSILMEYFLSDARVLATFAKHHSTEEPLSPTILNSLYLSQNVFPAYETQNQVVLAIMDQQFHGHHPLGKSTVEVYAELCRKYSPIDYVEGTASFLRFNHLYGYAAKYYSYLWARAVACLIWKSCFEADPFSRPVGERYRQMLKFGGGVHPWTLVEEMLGFEPTVDDLVEALYADILQQRIAFTEFNSLQNNTTAIDC